MAFDAGAVIGRLELDIAGWKKSVETVKKDQTSLSGLVMRHEKQFKSFGKAIALAGGAVVASFGAMVIKSANAGDAINDMSQRTGIATDILSGHKLALDKSGSSLEGFAVGMRGLSRVMDDANKGGKESQEVFADLGVSYADNEGKLRPLNDVLLDVADVFAQMPDGPEKAALAMKAFGRSGMELIPMLNMGKQGLQENYEATKRLGGLWSKEAAQAADKFNDSIAGVKMAGAGLAKEIGSILMPAVQSLVGVVTGIAVKVREWAAEHPGLASGLVKTAAGLGVMAAALGPVLIALPSLVKHIQILKAMSATPIIITIMIAIPVLAKAIADFKAELSNMRDAMKDTGASGFEAFLEGVNSGWRRVALGIKDSNVVLSEANALARLYATEGGRGMKDVILQEIPALSSWGALLQKYGIVTAEESAKKIADLRKEQAELKDALDAGKISQASYAEAMKKNTEEVARLTGAQKSLKEELGLTFSSEVEARIRKLNEALVTYRGKLTADEIQRICTEINTLQGRLTALKGPVIDLAQAFQTVMSSMDNLPATTEEIAAAINAEFKDLAEEMQADFEKLAMQDLPAHLRNIPEVSKSAAEETKSIWQEVSTVIADSMRNIASEIVGMVDFKGLFGATPKAVKFDSSYYDQMVAAATSAYEKEKSLIEANADARVEAARRAFDAQELLISRAEEDADRRLERRQDAEDRKYEAQYERDKRAIENSKMTEAQKQAALDALERKYEAAKLAREIAREDAKVARERAREDAKLARERAHEVALEAIRAAGLAKLLGLQLAHQADLDAIRIAEDTARQKQADDELKRQGSLWFKVKGIFGTACENMATIFLTKMFEPVGSLIGDLAAKLIGKGTDTVSGALDGTGEHVKGLGTTIGEFISGIGKGIGGFISGLATGIGAAIVSISSAIASAMVALATGIASAATIIAAAAPAIIVTSLLALGIMAGLNLLKRIFSSGGGGAGDGMGRVVERQDKQISLMTILKDLTIDNRALLVTTKTTLWAISTKLDKGVKDKLVTMGGYLKTIASSHYLRDVVGYLKSIDKKLPFPGGALGGVVMEPSLVNVAERRPEVIIPLDQYRAGAGGGAPIYVTMPIYLGTEKVDERMYRIANNRVEWLHSQYEHSNRMIPLRSIGGG